MGRSAPKTFTRTQETATRKRIDTILRNLRWRIDEDRPSCNVFTERCKTVAQQASLFGKKPDYVLYQSGTDRPIAIIETKRAGEDLRRAIQQAVNDHAVPLGVDVVFVSDGTIIESYDRRSGASLRLDGEPVTELLSEKDLLRFVTEGPDIRTPESARHSKRELINVFADANALLRKEGLREGIERFTEFSNLLFLKLISEMEDERERNREPRLIDKKLSWSAFKDRSAPDMLDYINDTILPRLVDRYNHSGDVFQHKLLITNPETLKKIVDKLSGLTLLDTDSDIKGDAFEYFLKNSVTVGNDLGEYFTPRHIVRLMVELIDPKFGETIYDPCCGTGGFLIEAFRHVRQKIRHSKATLHTLQHKTIYGRELTGTAKIAKMNMILTGDGHTNIEQVDSLKKPIKGKYDVILTNYPFSQQTDYSPYYGLVTTDANPVFLKHVIDALRPGGRAAIVVPEGLLFDEKKVYRSVRQILVDQCTVIAVIKLDSYVFQPYTTQPTSILIFEKAKRTAPVWFFDVKEDGFKKTSSQLGREPILENDLLTLRQLWSEKPNTQLSKSVDAKTIADHGYKLSLSEYRDIESGAQWQPLGGPNGLCELTVGGTPPTDDRRCWGGSHLWATIRDMDGREEITQTKRKLTDRGVALKRLKLVPKGSLMLSFKLTIGKVAFAGEDLYTNEAIVALTPKAGRVLARYLFYVLPRIDFHSYSQPTPKGRTLNSRILEQIMVPVPSPTEQAKIVQALDRRRAESLRLSRLAADLVEQSKATAARLASGDFTAVAD